MRPEPLSDEQWLARSEAQHAEQYERNGWRVEPRFDWPAPQPVPHDDLLEGIRIDAGRKAWLAGWYYWSMFKRYDAGEIPWPMERYESAQYGIRAVKNEAEMGE